MNFAVVLDIISYKLRISLRVHYIFIIITAFLLSGCLGSKYLKEDEKLLYKQKIKSSNQIDKEDLAQLYAQKPNRQFPIVPFSPYVWFYYYGQNRYDADRYKAKRNETRIKWNKKIAKAQAKEKSKKAKKLERKKQKKIARINKTIQEGNIWMRWGEPIAVYDSALSRLTMDRFKLYLYSKGYFQASVDTTLRLYNDKVSIKYIIEEGEPYTIDTVMLESTDDAITQLIKKNKDDSQLKVGENYDQSKISDEREWIDQLLKDNGYFDFSRQYVEFNVDTAFGGDKKIAIETVINEPKKGSHRVFTVDSVNFTTDANAATTPSDSLRKSETYNGTTYRFYENLYNFKILNRRVFIKKDSVYSKSNTFTTQRQLANLDHFRFININYDSADGKLIANIYTSPLSRYQWTNEVGINVTQGFPGPFYNVSFKKRNVFRGLEILELNGRVGIEGVAPATEVQEVYASVEAGVNASLTFPQFVLPLSGKAKERLGRLNPKTRLLTGYTYTDRPEYVRENINISNSYSWQSEKQTLFNFTTTDISIINSDLSQSFRDTLIVLAQRGNRLINTFRPSFVSSMNFSTTWNNNSYGINFENSSFFRIYLESGGTSLNFIDPGPIERQGLEYYKYIKFSIDKRKINPINENTTLAYRINAGIAKPYSENQILPYEKYFFAGGSNGIRAWRPRRLGPGSFSSIDSVSNRVTYNFEQPGELLIEGSIELRKNLIGFIDYAAFIDFGNIWMIQKDPSRPGSQFKLDRFYKEIAVGGGLGLRFDFSFLVLRLDAGMKLYDPARPEGKRFITSSGYYDEPFTPTAAEAIVLNIGIGYPF
ncbi:BamA/TamA family outer membrane protein [Fulvivirga maritima]|uniref:translocation and assembly module lipoprotein TamL n=1 Tax=Fulvivirga maritima TaxID=2904247 RepID=UPI001F33D389|nr:BamA/TamA family outer membrane protein [Fulvivirga maritima]UII26639.1 BamA/TamA family outer membrane protein [Fulvivirga maritima]